MDGQSEQGQVVSDDRQRAELEPWRFGQTREREGELTPELTLTPWVNILHYPQGENQRF